MANAATAGVSDAFTFNMQTKASVIKDDGKGGQKVIGDVVLGKLVWGIDLYDVRSGPWGDGALPVGTYTVDWVHLVEGSSASSDADFKEGFKFPSATTLKTSMKIEVAGVAARLPLTGFFIPISADFGSSRGHLGIHPDGNVYGTEGCIGLVDADAQKFWQKVLATPAKLRPKKLLVSGTPQIATSPVSISGNPQSE